MPSPSEAVSTPGRALPRGGVQSCRRHGHVAQGSQGADGAFLWPWLTEFLPRSPRSPGMWLQHVNNMSTAFFFHIEKY